MSVINHSSAINMLQRVRNVHFIGIGGVGMSGIAEVMASLGFHISGSDLKNSAVIQRLTQAKINVAIGHDANNITDKDVVVVSSAIDDTNPEVKAARKHRIPIIPRAEMLAELMRFKQGIAIAGTHGKTTTTSLVASILAQADYDPTYVIGGKLNSSASNARLGAGEYLVAEADESDASFLYLQPVMAVVTNIDADHLSTYDHDFEKLKQSFVEFLHHLPFYGLAVLCADDININAILAEVTKPFITYGIDAQADISAKNIVFSGLTTQFTVSAPQQSFAVQLNMPGKHNVLNALAAIGIALELQISVDVIQQALADFAGIGRRFQVYDDIHVQDGYIKLVDDYGHHPREVEATIQAVRSAWPERRLVVVFQPHRYSRTQDLFDDFCAVLSTVDVLCLTEVYAAGEVPIKDANGRALSSAIRARGRVTPIFVKDIKQVADVIEPVLQDNDILLTLGAGSIGRLAAELQSRFSGANS